MILGWGVEPGILSENPRLELLQPGTRVEAELFDQRGAGFTERPEGIGLPAGPVQREHRQLPEPLAQRMALTERL